MWDPIRIHRNHNPKSRKHHSPHLTTCWFPRFKRAAICTAVSLLPERVIAESRDLFLRLDLDGDGTVSSQDLKKADLVLFFGLVLILFLLILFFGFVWFYSFLLMFSEFFFFFWGGGWLSKFWWLLREPKWRNSFVGLPFWVSCKLG